MSDDKDYLAYISFGGGGTYARGKDMEYQIQRCKKIFLMDWGSVYKIDEDSVEIDAYDVTGFNCIEVGSKVGYTDEDCEVDGVYFGKDKFIKTVKASDVKTIRRNQLHR